MPRCTQNHALEADHEGQNVALAALVERTIERNVFPSAVAATVQGRERRGLFMEFSSHHHCFRRPL